MDLNKWKTIVACVGFIVALLFFTLAYLSALGMIWFTVEHYYETHYWLTMSIRIFCSSILSMFMTFLFGTLVFEFLESIRTSK